MEGPALAGPMSMIALAFELRWIGTGHAVASALVCPAGRYAAVRWSDSDKIDRRFASPLQWQAIERELRDIPIRQLLGDSECCRMLVPDRARWITVHFLGTRRVATDALTSERRSLRPPRPKATRRKG